MNSLEELHSSGARPGARSAAGTVLERPAKRDAAELLTTNNMILLNSVFGWTRSSRKVCRKRELAGGFFPVFGFAVPDLLLYPAAIQFFPSRLHPIYPSFSSSRLTLTVFPASACQPASTPV